MAEKPRKLSELEQIVNISDDDLFLVSDNDNGECISKKMTVAQAVSHIGAAVAENPIVIQTVQQAVERAISADLEQIIMQTVKNNMGTIADLIADGDIDQTMTIDGNNS